MSELNIEGAKSAHIGRRAVLCGAVAIALGISTDLASASVPAVGIKQIGKKIQLDLAKNKALAKVGGAVTIDLSNGSSVAIVRTSAGVKGFTALNLSCTHQGVTVEQQGSTWVCPAHGSAFSSTGKVVRGPANQALFAYPVAATAKTVTIG
ncbi:MAG: Rieske 2Fe-2S domain-containing protein [Actinomycetes bacterium]